ncbi:MAG: argininosuccinate synthase, partial [Deltaproteobacteria bacterium]|nr:argininosuccinate synthase [Deltaproteobacteria bacterium]
ADYMAYDPHKLSMEKVEQPFFTPEDRIGALELQNLSVTDNRAFLAHWLDAVRGLSGGAGDDVKGLLGGGT